jgi:hypothetical protein
MSLCFYIFMQDSLHYLPKDDIPIRFVAELIGSIVPASHIIAEAPAIEEDDALGSMLRFMTLRI